ncbi:MAG: excinuclease ABC subunit UvrC [Planctomycetota bacterium]
MSDTAPHEPRSRTAVLAALRERLADLPADPGVYLFKDAEGRVLYVGKAKSLRSRVSSYFQPGANLIESRGPEIERMIAQRVADMEVLVCDSEVDALLNEARLIKDIRPQFNSRQKDDKSFPYLMITTGEAFPGVYITRQPQRKGVKLFGPFVSPRELRAALPLMQRAFKFRTCTLQIDPDDEGRRHFRPCILHNIKQCTAPCAARISREDYRKNIQRLIRFLQSKRTEVVKQLTTEMDAAAKALDFERAAELRDELKALESLSRRGLADEPLQPEVFEAPVVVEPRQATATLAEALGLDEPPRTLEGADIAHLSGSETVGSIVTFIDGKPFKSGYRRFKIVSHDRNDDYASLREVVWRRYRYAGMDESLFPDIILIDGGKGQLAAAYSAFDDLEFRPPMLVSLAKKEELLFVHGRDEPLRLQRNDPALHLLQYVRDEAHRFAQHYHHILRRRRLLGKKDNRKKPTRAPRRAPKRY